MAVHRGRGATTQAIARALLAAVVSVAGVAPSALAQALTPLPESLQSADLLAQSRPAAAIAVLEKFAAEPQAATLAVQRALLLRLRRAHLDLGDYPAARLVNARLSVLGQRQHDPITLTYAALPAIDDDLRGYRPDSAKAALDGLERGVDPRTMPDLAFDVHMAYGRTFLLKAEYERAIERFQAGVKLSERTEHPAAARIEALTNLAYTYLGLHDPAGGARMVAEAYEADNGSLRARQRTLLRVTSALVLIDAGKLAEADTEFRHALQISRDSGMRVVEARVLGDWADLALRRERYADAERIGREALALADAIHDTGSMITARANIGFALGGQGKMSEGLPYIDAVIAHFRTQGNSQALLAMLDEKGRLLQRQGWLKETVTLLREQQQLERDQFSAQRGKAVAALQDRFERAENQRSMQLLKEQNRLKDAVIRNRDLQRLVLGLAALLMLAVGTLAGLLYRRARRSNAQLQLLNARLAEHALRDPLTGLHNRRFFVERMQTRVAHAEHERRHSEAAAGGIFLMLDLDHFKQVNDTWGHAAGDAVLVEVARRLQTVVRESDTVLRWGGEEFVIHSPGNADAGHAEALARRLLEVVSAEPVDAGVAQLRVSVSAGMIELPFAALADGPDDWQRALQLADSALYLAKGAGRNRCCQLLAGERALTMTVSELERDLAGAARAGQVSLRSILASLADSAALDRTQAA